MNLSENRVRRGGQSPAVLGWPPCRCFPLPQTRKAALVSNPTTPIKSKAIDAGSGTTLAKVVPTRSSSKLKRRGPRLEGR